MEEKYICDLTTCDCSCHILQGQNFRCIACDETKHGTDSFEDDEKCL